ncbi:multidrug efflux SMR transporter [Brevibacillus brevis]|uniref:Multidrug efflux SMR transporter n=1 Tax=Brevibacillus brevis TaxID=1393 RepID=A0ABY9TA16_BREBE|nr:multidrug efflux SMR transporter [Brevibacillus brevis]WNC16289.1 multidrug efflux SMR transporter [Brevibacillus brevis]
MEWIALFIAGLCEVLGVFAIKRVTEHRSLLSYLLLVVAFGASFSLLMFAMTRISMGTAYAVWTGIGTVGSAVLGMFAFGEPKEWRRLLFICLILVSAVGLKWIS